VNRGACKTQDLTLMPAVVVRTTSADSVQPVRGVLRSLGRGNVRREPVVPLAVGDVDAEGDAV
jgi:hypothetical protein